MHTIKNKLQNSSSCLFQFFAPLYRDIARLLLFLVLPICRFLYSNIKSLFIIKGKLQENILDISVTVMATDSDVAVVTALSVATTFTVSHINAIIAVTALSVDAAITALQCQRCHTSAHSNITVLSLSSLSAALLVYIADSHY